MWVFIAFFQFIYCLGHQESKRYPNDLGDNANDPLIARQQAPFRWTLRMKLVTVRTSLILQLHQLMPNILTCIVAKKLSSQVTDNHWALRDFACLLASHICEHYGASYPTLQPRLIMTLLRAFLDHMKPYSTNYGAIVGLAALGPETVKMVLFPNVKDFGNRLKKDLEGENGQKKHDARKCFDALLVRVQLIIKCR